MRPVYRWVLFVGACIGLLWASGAGGLLAGKATATVSDVRASRAAATPTDPTLRAKTLAAHQATVDEMKKHPERYRVSWQRTYKPTREELAKMPWGAKGEQEVGTIYSGTLWADLSMGAPIRTTYAEAISASSAGGAC